MKIFGLEIKKVTDAVKRGKTWKGRSIGSWGDLPANTFDLFYKYYRKNAILRRCIVELQENVGVGGHYYIDIRNGEEIENETTKVFNIRLNANQSLAMMKARIIRDIGVTGNSYLLKLKNTSGKIIGYQALDPRTVAIVANVYGDVQKYVQRVKMGAGNQEFDAEDIFHLYDEPDPDNEIFGLSLLEGLIIDILGDDEAALTNYYHMKRGAIPSFLVKLKDGMSDDQKNAAVEQMKKNFAGGKNKGKIGVIDGIESIDKLTESMKDMEWRLLREFNVERVCATYGVPKAILNYTDGVNYANSEIQYQKFIENTIRPRERKLEAWITTMLQEFDPNLQFRFRDNHINDAKEKTDILAKQIDYGLMTINEGRAELGLEPYDVEEADLPIVLANKTLVSDVGIGPLDINPDETNG